MLFKVVKQICQTNPSRSSKECYSLRCSCLKLKLSCSKCSRCRYCLNGKGREAHPFKSKLNSCLCRSRDKSESLSECSNTFGNDKSRCPCLKSKRYHRVCLYGCVSWAKSRTARKFHTQKERIKSMWTKELQSIWKCKDKSFRTECRHLARRCCFIA